MKAEARLSLCPFCGGNNIGRGPVPGSGWCVSCGADADEWNRRDLPFPPRPEDTAEIERLRGEVERLRDENHHLRVMVRAKETVKVRARRYAHSLAGDAQKKKSSEDASL